MDKIKINKTRIFLAVYVVLIIIELFFYVPYHSIQVFTSNQNVPHTEIIGSGYATMTDITYDNAYVKTKRSSETGKRVDTSQLFMNVSITTIIFIALYLFLLKNEKDNPKNEAEKLLLQNKQLQSTIEHLRSDNEKLKAYKKELKKSLSEQISIDILQGFPDIDIDGLAFADYETQEEAKIKYAEDMYTYIITKISKINNMNMKNE